MAQRIHQNPRNFAAAALFAMALLLAWWLWPTPRPPTPPAATPDASLPPAWRLRAPRDAESVAAGREAQPKGTRVPGVGFRCEAAWATPGEEVVAEVFAPLSAYTPHVGPVRQRIPVDAGEVPTFTISRWADDFRADDGSPGFSASLTQDQYI